MNEQHQEILAVMTRTRLLAILRTTDQQLAARAMRAAVDGGFRMVEFTLNTPGALELIAEFSSDPRIIVGAGTVMTIDDVRRSIDAGARFIVSPHTDAEIIRETRVHNAVSVPGAYTPSEMLHADRSGADFIKLFPSPADIAQYVRQIIGPLPHLRIVPTAGVTPENYQDVLKAGATGVGFVSSLFTPADMDARNFDAIRKRAEQITSTIEPAGD
ncbi:MAG: bifunctional 4-hydroxy-2-oxoglutarate aldolase/2-dehydro-3-deoxy-phosphogluconate aldolase [Planctomycetes bacterium]|nr:bifunctional 4-hydroxy-2-oxoglutarate aldolase/2-dehydro-3-deoxy-phosphogluconate aldolase [Planctomycetota bacterium]